MTVPLHVFEDGLWLLRLQELLEDGQMDQFHKALIELNMDSPEELQSYIQKLSAAVEQAKQKMLQAEVSLEVDVVDSKPEVLRASGGGPMGSRRENSPFSGQEGCLQKADIEGLVARRGRGESGAPCDVCEHTGAAGLALTLYQLKC